MKKTLRGNIETAYSLHDMNVISFEIAGSNLIMRTQPGMSKTTSPYAQPDGYVEFQNVDWDFCYVYLLDFTGNVGSFTGKKMFLKNFIPIFINAVFSVMDENYGYNQTKYAGYLSMNRTVKECIIEIYHTGDMIFVTEE